MVPDGVIDADSDEPAEQQIVFQPLHQKPLRADRISACNSIALSSFSGGIGAENSRSNVLVTIVRIARSG